MRRLLLPACLLVLALPTVALLAPAPTDARDDAEGAEIVPLREMPRTTTRERARIELGRRLFFDPAASPSGARSCASCHSPDHGWSDPARVSADDVGDTRRHSQTILDAGFHANAHWDGEFASVEDLVVARLGTNPHRATPGGGYGGHMPFTPSRRGRRGSITKNRKDAKEDVVTPGERREVAKAVPVHPGMSRIVVKRLQHAERYGEGFKAAFGEKQVTLGRIAQAIAAFTYSVEATRSPYDRYVAGEADALSASAKRGLGLFNGRAGCNQCHTSEPLTEAAGPAFFTDFRFHNTGVAHHQLVGMDLDADTEEALRVRIMRGALEGQENRVRKLLMDLADQGRFVRTFKAKDKRTFKTPTLRDVAKRGPYMHNGRFQTLAEVIAYYAGGCGPDAHKSKLLKTFECSEQDTQDLVAFLESLSGESRPGKATSVWSRRARSTRMVLVDSVGKPLREQPVKLVPVGQALPVDRDGAGEVLEAVTDRRGIVRFKHGNRTHMRVVVPGGVEPTNGALIPDTCKNVVVAVPIAGRITFVITFGAHETPPEQLVGLHIKHEPLVGHPRIRTVLERVGKVVEVEGGVQATYEGWARTDAGTAIKLVIPGRSLADGHGQGRRKHVYHVQAGAEYRLDARPSDD